MTVFLYSEGEMPYAFLKAKEKFEMSLNPHWMATAAIDRVPLASRLFACLRRTDARYFAGEIFISFLNR